MDDMVAMKSERSSMLVGMAESGYCTRCWDTFTAVSFGRDSVVVEPSRIPDVLKPLLSCLLWYMRCSPVAFSRGWSMVVLNGRTINLLRIMELPN